MNKIDIDSSSIIIDKEESYVLKIDNEIELTINVDKNIKSRLIIYSESSDYNLVINLEENSELIINSLNNNTSCNVKANLLANSSIEYNHSLVANTDVCSKFVINHLNKNTKSVINNSGINLDNNKLFFEIDGIIPKESDDSEAEQHSKIINFKNGNSKIIPNFIIDNHNVVANHSAYIGNFREDDIFYIKSRGIDVEEMYRLLYRSLLLGTMKLEEEKELFNKLLKEWGLL